MQEMKLIVSSSPHVRSGLTTEQIMRDVVIALVPATLAGAMFFGYRALLIVMVSTVTAVLTEAGLEKVRGQRVTVGDFSAAVTGMLLGLVIPPTVPLWIPVIGSVVSIGIAKALFGGLGYNPFNPALIGRAILLASWPVFMTTWAWPVKSASWVPGFDALTTATPLALMKLQGIKTPYSFLFLGNVAGSIGETSAVAILLGAAYLLYRGHITWSIPGSYLITVGLLALVFRQDPIYHVLAGGLLFGAFFMATDYVTSPVTRKGQVVFGVGCGILTILIRLFGGYPEGVCYAILIMNSAAPLIDKYTRPRAFGEVRSGA